MNGNAAHLQDQRHSQMIDDNDDSDEIIGEVEMIFSPRLEALASRNIAIEDFEAALVLALENRQAFSPEDEIGDDDLTPLEEMTLEIGGVIYTVEDLAEIEILEDID
jgi:hypothetical protein